MKKLLFLISIVLLNSCSNKAQDNFTKNLIYDQLERPADVEYYHMPIGLCEDWPEESTTREIYINDFELLKKTGINYFRISFGWDAIEGEKDKYDWLFWDDFVKTGVEKYNITMVPYVCYTPQWVSREPQDTMLYWNKPAVDFEEWGQFMYDLVTRYKPWLKTWELWNEPDIPIYWDTQDVADFARFVKIGADAVRRADPEAKVVLGGIAYRPEWIQALFEEHGVSPYIDIVNCHNYFETWHKDPVENIVDYIDDVYEVVHKYGAGQPIWMAEVGYSTFRASDGKVSDSYSCYFDYEHTPAYQAVDLIKRIALVRSTEKIDALAWYEIKDLAPTEEVIGDIYNNKHLGIAWADHSFKPASHAISFINKLLTEPVKNISNDVIVNKQKNSESHVVALQKENGDVILFAWIQTHIPEKHRVKNDGNNKDNRSENISIEIPSKFSKTALLFNELGEKQKFENLKITETETKVNELSLKGGQIVILEIEK